MRSRESGNSSTAAGGNEKLECKLIAILAFPFVAAALVLLAGRKDAARDPRLTLVLLALLVFLPLIGMALPKVEVLPAAAGYPWMRILSGMWALGFLVALGRLAFAAMLISGWRKESEFLGEADGVTIRVLKGLRGPVAAGILRKTVFVPGDWEKWPEQSRRIVLAHELAHHRRRDPLWRFLVELVRAVHWWNPLVHWMVRRFVLQCECACDESVLRHGADARDYALVLCDCAEKDAGGTFALAMADGSFLETRVARILSRKSKCGRLVLAALVGIGIMAACGLAMLGRKADRTEVELRFSANPFPGEP